MAHLASEVILSFIRKLMVDMMSSQLNLGDKGEAGINGAAGTEGTPGPDVTSRCAATNVISIVVRFVIGTSGSRWIFRPTGTQG